MWIMYKRFYNMPKILIISLAALMMLFFPLEKQASTQRSLQNMIYQAYVDNHMPKWESTLRAMEMEYSRNPSDSLLYDLILAQYGLIGYYLGTGKDNEGGKLLDQAEKNLEKLKEKSGYEAQSLAFEGAFYGYRIAQRSIRGVRLGPRSSRVINQALEKNPDYPRAWVEKGNVLFYAPSVLGGSKTEAITYYKKAIELMEKNMQNNHRWLYLGTLVSLANAYEKTGQLEMAIQTLEKSLDYEPGFQWVKEELLPEFKAKK